MVVPTAIYIVRDETTGSAAYLISGGFNGGALWDCLKSLVPKEVVLAALALAAILVAAAFAPPVFAGALAFFSSGGVAHAALAGAIALTLFGLSTTPAYADKGDSGPRNDECEEDECEAQYRIDTDTCNGITRNRGARRGAGCHASAAERYAACLVGRDIPPLNTWNN